MTNDEEGWTVTRCRIILRHALRPLASPIIHDGSLRKRADAKRDVYSEAGDWLCRLRQCPAPQTGAGIKKKGPCPQQYVEGLNGETARCSRVSALVAELHEHCGL